MCTPGSRADNDAPGDALAEEMARRLGRERCWRVRWPLNRGDFEYVASQSRLVVAAAEQPLDAAQAPPEGGALSVAPDLSAAASSEESSSGSSSSSSAGGLDAPAGQDLLHPPGASAAAAGATLPSAVEPEWYRKDANEVLVRDGPDFLKAFIEQAEPFPIRGLLRRAGRAALPWRTGGAASAEGLKPPSPACRLQVPRVLR